MGQDRKGSETEPLLEEEDLDSIFDKKNAKKKVKQKFQN